MLGETLSLMFALLPLLWWAARRTYMYGQQRARTTWANSDKQFLMYIILRLLKENDGDKLSTSEIQNQIRYATVGFLNHPTTEYKAVLKVLMHAGHVMGKEDFEITQKGKAQLKERMQQV